MVKTSAFTCVVKGLVWLIKGIGKSNIKTNIYFIFGTIMGKIQHILINLVVVFISFLFVDEGKTILLIGNNIQIHLIHNQAGDTEFPHQHNHNKPHVDETWINSNSFELQCSSEKLALIPFYQNGKTADFTGLIWQPPKVV